MPWTLPGAAPQPSGLPQVQHHTYAAPDGSNVSVHVSTATVPGTLFDMLNHRVGASRMHVAGNEALIFPLNGRPFSPLDIFSPA